MEAEAFGVSGKIDLDSRFGKEIGFTSNRFDCGSYLFKVGNYVYISFIHSKEQGKGYLSSLFDAIQNKGFGIKVPTPFAKMEAICVKKGFKKTQEFFEAAGENADVYVNPVPVGEKK